MSEGGSITLSMTHEHGAVMPQAKSIMCVGRCDTHASCDLWDVYKTWTGVLGPPHGLGMICGFMHHTCALKTAQLFCVLLCVFEQKTECLQSNLVHQR